MELHNLSKTNNKKSKGKIVGRGIGSGKGGHTVGRGMNGQRSRSGGSKSPRVDFEGGQNPISRRLPKLRGFSRAFDSKVCLIIDTKLLNTLPEGTINIEKLIEFNCVDISNLKNDSDISVKVLFNCDVDKKFDLVGLKCSTKVKESLEKKGGSITQ